MSHIVVWERGTRRQGCNESYAGKGVGAGYVQFGVNELGCMPERKHVMFSVGARRVQRAMREGEDATSCAGGCTVWERGGCNELCGRGRMQRAMREDVQCGNAEGATSYAGGGGCNELCGRMYSVGTRGARVQRAMREDVNEL